MSKNPHKQYYQRRPVYPCLENNEPLEDISKLLYRIMILKGENIQENLKTSMLPLFSMRSTILRVYCLLTSWSNPKNSNHRLQKYIIFI